MTEVERLFETFLIRNSDGYLAERLQDFPIMASRYYASGFCITALPPCSSRSRGLPWGSKGGTASAVGGSTPLISCCTAWLDRVAESRQANTITSAS